jgi:hypothetical protein
MLKKIFISGIILLILDAIFISSISKEFGKQVASIQRTAMVIKPLGALI